VVYGVYFVFSWNQPTDGLEMLGRSPAALVLRRLLMPPYQYAMGLAGFAIMASRPTFLLGHAYTHGVWFYFPVLFLLKSTLAFLALTIAAFIAAIAARRRFGRGLVIAKERELHWRAVWVFLLVFVAGCIASQLDLSIRHFTSPLVLLILLLSPLPRLLERLRVPGWLAAALAVASLFTAVRAYPYYLPFLNSLSLGHPGYELVNDSNLDWNQALPDVREFAELHGLESVRLDEYGFSDPTVYVPQARFWNCQQPTAADAGHWAVVSANLILESHNCLWLFGYPSQRLAGGSMYAFQLPAEIPPAGAPGGPPVPAAWHNFGGNPPSWPDVRFLFLRVIFDPQQLPLVLDELLSLGRPGVPQTHADSGSLRSGHTKPLDE